MEESVYPQSEEGHMDRDIDDRTRTRWWLAWGLTMLGALCLGPRPAAAQADLNEDPKTIQFIAWGLRPVWLKKIAKRKELINVKAETFKVLPDRQEVFEGLHSLVRRAARPSVSVFPKKKGYQ
jgi:hypothetical protein